MRRRRMVFVSGIICGSHTRGFPRCWCLFGFFIGRFYLAHAFSCCFRLLLGYCELFLDQYVIIGLQISPLFSLHFMICDKTLG